MKKIAMMILILSLAVLACGCGGKTVAEVNGEEITYEDFSFYWDNLSKIYEANDETLSDEMKGAVAEQMVYDTLLEQVAAELDVLPTAEEEESYYLAKIELDYGSYEDAMDLINEHDLDEDFFRHQYRCRLYEECIMESLAADGSADVSEEEARDLFETAPEMYDWREVSVLLVKPYAADGRVLTADNDGNTIYTEEEWNTAKTTCEGYLEELEGGELFSSLAKMYSDDSTAGGGGKLTERIYRDTEGYEQEFIDAAFALKNVGDYTKSPVKMSYGYELIFCDAVLTPDRPEEVIAYIIEEQTEANRRSLLSTYMTDKEDTSEIVYYAENWE